MEVLQEALQGSAVLTVDFRKLRKGVLMPAAMRLYAEKAPMTLYFRNECKQAHPSEKK